jgi:prepilin-type N-terminal cleavage/methylation domain-containing protein
MSTQNSSLREHGFTLIELLVAMVVTLIITGAVVQLMGAGKGAFRREPEVSDRQQNIRIGMAVITQDLHKAGLGLPPFSQSFTNSLNGIGPMGPGGANTDELEILTMTECPILSVCSSTGTTATTWEPLPQCFGFPALVALWDETNWGVFWAEAPGAGGTSSCSGGGGGGGKVKNGHVVMPHGKDKFHNPPGGPGFDPDFMGIISVVRYRVVIDAEGVPNLWRSAFGGSTLGGGAGGASTWQLIARGVEDLQVDYQNGVGWNPIPGVVSCGASCATPTPAQYNTIVRKVRVRLSSRATAANLQGQTTSAVGSAVRGQLQAEVSPRAALVALSGAGTWY